MDNLQLESFVKNLIPLAEIKAGKQFTEAIIPPGSLHELAKNLRDSKETLFDFLFCLTGVDFGANLGVVYHLRSTEHEHSIVLKAMCSDRNSPKLDSVSDIWRTAEFLENEVYDLLGIHFTNHPKPRRLFLEEKDGFPLRKDFTDTINIVTK
jgi:NADH:ubiquinone oxidoreductase subunit C